ncbi:MAG: VanZ family protein [Gammaproteobacteria bacterium]|nr:VanZ family protein [Gammaproteobacteria bacterium]MDE2349799.1 VanZ family protein [Gammaproteobacteria bacterium]
MNRERPGGRAAVADQRTAARWFALGIALLILWGSLYPLQFFTPSLALMTLRLARVGAHAPSRTDLIANFLLYLPLGAACRLAFGRGGSARRTVQAALLGASFSLAVELLQLTTPHRVTSVFDWAWNSAGASFGALAVACYLRIGGAWRLPALRHPRPAFVPLCLLAIWFIGEFAPYLPSRHASLPLGGLIAAWLHRREPVAASWSLALARWWIIAECLRHIWRRPWHLPAFAALIALTAVEQAYVGTDRRSAVELLSWCIVPVLMLVTSAWPARARAWCTIVGCLAVLVSSNVWPPLPAARIGDFHWIPFSGTLLASRDYRPLLDSLFFDGALLWALTLAFGRPLAAFALTLAASIAVELAHLWTPPHRAEITNPLLVVALVMAFATAHRFQRYAFGADGAGERRTT